MKKTTLRMTVISACVGAGLALSACGGADSAEAGGTGEDTGTSQEEGGDEGGERSTEARLAVSAQEPKRTRRVSSHVLSLRPNVNTHSCAHASA